ncbi:MAG: DUF29 family protein [Acidithiobacillaceae bacterium]|nr:DUF29 family protein [Acidithiobacillaceae bacterium]MBU2747308.1 DUF29 domain-containing protein [Acidithiobacillus montserratensis]
MRIQRREINDLLAQSGSLKPYLLEKSATTWSNACEDAADETGLPLQTFPLE